jgi:acetyl esterase/lipase
MRRRVFLSSLFALSFAGAAQTSPTEAALPAGVELEANIPYDQFPETVLDIYTPATAATGKRPGVLVIHGGGWVNGTKEAVVERFVLPYLEQGFVVANVEYRLAKAAPAPAAVQDVLKAAEWFRKNGKRWNVDTKRIVVTGGSAGGHLSLMVGMTPKSAKLGPETEVAAIVNFYGITDVEDQLQGANMRKYAVTWVPESEDRADVARRVSPLTYVRKDVPAILTIHGTADQTVPYDHGVNLTRKLREAGADAEMISVPDGKHGFSKEQMSGLYDQIFDFLRKREILQ